MRTIAAIIFSSLIVSIAMAEQTKQTTATPATPTQPVAAKSVVKEQQTATPENSLGLAVARAVIAKGIDENGPVDAGTEFSSDVKRVYCITQIKGAQETIQIEHRWYMNDNLISSIPLPIKSLNWRTQSYKTILPSMTGAWKVVVVLMPKEEVLTTLAFTVK
jgi:hypothetical protein